MRRLDLYIFRQLLTPLVFSVAVITAIVWITQTLQRLELVVEDGEGWAAFFGLTLLLVPSLLVIVIPFAVFGAALFALHRLHTDSEIAVMFAAGVSKLRIAAPILLIASLGALATLWINLDIMPKSYRQLKMEIADIRADFAASVLKSGEFVTVADGFTIYVDDVIPGGQFRGLLVNDYRKDGPSETYMAQYGALRETDAGPILFLSRGNIQTVSKTSGVVEIIEFERTAINVAEFKSSARNLQLELTERFLGELLNPDMTKAWDRENKAKLIAEGHSRLAAPIMVIAFALIALYAMVGRAYSRRSYTWRIVAACAAAGVLQVVSYVVLGLVGATGNSYWLLYATPLIPLVILAFLLSDTLKRPASRPAPQNDENGAP